MNSKDTEIINGFLNNFFKNSNSKNIELEFRFGKIFKNEFKPENNALVFYEICNLLKKYFKYRLAGMIRNFGLKGGANSKSFLEKESRK